MTFDLDRIGGARALDRLVDEVLEAGKHARQLFAAGRAHVETKPDRSPVTVADREVEQRLQAFLRSAHPSTSFLGEETGFLGEEKGASGATSAALSWLVDPIDGTRAFVRGMTTWSVLVALLDGGEPVIAVGYFPAEDDLYVAVQGLGAHRNGRSLRVSSVASMADATVTHGALIQFPGDVGLRVLGALRDGTNTQRGYADFDGHRNVLLGRADAMIDPGVQPWDAAVPMLLVREAGGMATSLRGQTALGSVVPDLGVITSNGLVHDELIATLARAGL